VCLKRTIDFGCGQARYLVTVAGDAPEIGDM
jgi:hypothetical protein